MRVHVKSEVCVGHGMCILACSELFALSDEDGHAFVLSNDVPPGLEEHVEQAQRSCPEGAIHIS